MTVKLGIVGLGRFAEHHVAIWRRFRNVIVAGVCDVDEQRAQVFARDLGCSPFTSLEEMLRVVDLDAIVVLTPEHVHFGPVMLALTSGKHVFIEKPLAVSVHDGEQMVAAAKDAKRILMVGHVLRFDPRYYRIMEWIQQGRLGKLRYLYARRNNGARFFPLYQRVNPVLILGIHDIDLMLWYTGQRVEGVTATFSYGSMNDQPDLVHAVLRFDGGCVAVIENHWLLPDGYPSYMDARLDVTGTQGLAGVTDPEESLKLWEQGGCDTPGLFSWTHVHGYPLGALQTELAHFVDCVESGIPSRILLPNDALESVRVCCAILESGRTGSTVQLDTSR